MKHYELNEIIIGTLAFLLIFEMIRLAFNKLNINDSFWYILSYSLVSTIVILYFVHNKEE